MSVIAQRAWQTSRLGDAFQTVTGNTPPKKHKHLYGSAIPLVKPPELLNAETTDAHDGLSEEGKRVARVAPAGSVLVSCIGNLGKIALAGRDLAFNQQINAIMPDSKTALPKFVFYFCLAPQFVEQLEGLSSGTTVSIVNKSRFNSISIPLPPLEEQKRIVAVLDQAFAALDRARALVEANLADAGELFENSLDAIFDTLRERGRSVRLEEICTIGDGNHSSKYPKRDEMVEQGVPFLRSSNIQDGEIVTDDLLYISPKKHQELKKGHLQVGDILFTNRGEIGKVAILPEEFDGSNLNSQVAWLRSRNTLSGEFLFFYLQSGIMRRHYQNAQTGAALQQFPIKMVKAIEVPVPDLEEQLAIAEQLGELRAKAVNLANSYQLKREAIADLRQSLLQNAFAGELT